MKVRNPPILVVVASALAVACLLPAGLAAQAKPAPTPPPAAAPAPPAAAAKPAPAPAAKPAAPVKPPTLGSLAVPSLAAADYQRIDLPGGTPDHPFPYTIEIPKSWKVNERKGSPVLLLGVDGVDPEKDPRVVVVRISRAPLDKPEETVKNIKLSAENDPSFKAPLVEVREVGGTRGVLVEMRSGSGDAERGTLVLKMPLPKTSVDFLASAAAADFPKLRPFFERVLLSVRPRK
ncbi:MAG TPA: hypothetical protein VGE98_00345 [Thermoanaerobaculia bacterium]